MTPYPKARTGSEERAVFDLRLQVTADDRSRVFEITNDFVRRAREIAPDGVDVRYTTLRASHALSPFKPTIEPKRRTRARRVA